MKYKFDINDSRTWFYYPIIMPLTIDGKGPASGREIDTIVFEVWDQLFETQESFKYLPDAINYAIKRNQEIDGQSI
jgi:hypothetical protein